MRRFLRNRDGAAAVEFGLIAPLVAAVLVGIATMGGLILAHNKMRQAVNAGAQYAMTVTPDDLEAIEAAVVAAWDGMPVGADVNVVQECRCGTAVSVCNTICESDGDYPEKATTITATRSYSDFTGEARTLTSREEIRTW